jgi:hypothetical protein
MNSAFSPLSALLGTSERRIQHHQTDTIDADHAALEFARNAQCLVDILGEDACHEAEVGVVGQGHDLFFRLERLDDADGAEDLLTMDFRCWIDVYKDRRLDEIALLVPQSA